MDHHVESTVYHYTVRAPWSWVLERVADDLTISCAKGQSTEEGNNDDGENTPSDLRYCCSHRNLPSYRRPEPRKHRRPPMPCTLRLDRVTTTRDGVTKIESFHGTSWALNGLEDKDVMVRTFEEIESTQDFIPPSILLPWDCTEQNNDVWAELCSDPQCHWPHLNKLASFAVLKQPLGSRGDGIYFVKGIEQVREIVETHRVQALRDIPFLESIRAQKGGRMPSWGT